ncbi:odorant receptor 4-like [Rhodnius prolixus]|uniref:Odorant receptor n=1 Tax=Rhodnius prolixus TaxID=13249 RepID=T1H999_RHOPR
MNRFINYFANDDKKVGFTLPKAVFNAIGLSWWGTPTLLKSLYKPVAFIILGFITYGVTNYLSEKEIVDQKTFIEVTVNIIQILSMLFVATKIFLFHCYSSDISDAINTSEILQLKYGVTCSTPTGSKVIKIYATNIAIAVTGWLVLGTYKHGHPLHVSFPFDISTKHPIRFLIVWFLEVMCGFYVSAGNGAADTIPLYTVNVIVNFGEKLKDLLRKIGQNPDEDVKLLEEALDLHLRILELKDKLIKGFAMLVLVQIVFTISHTCLILFAATKVDIALFMSLLMPLTFADYLELLVYCFTGEMLSSKMEELRFAAYDNQWYNSSIATRKNLIRIMEALKRPISLNGYGIVSACYETYLNSIKESFSYYIVVKTLASDFK